MDYYLAVDIGAGSGRHILGHLEGGKLLLEEVYRFDNTAKRQNGRLCWDVGRLFSDILEGLRRCKSIGKIPISVGIDTWGVDMVLLDRNGEMAGEAVCYRDRQNAGMDAEVEKILPFEELYRRTGIQKLVFNTVYQLTAVRLQNPEWLNRAERILMVPDYFHYLLTGRMENEYTAASTTALINPSARDWDYPLIERLGFPKKLFQKISPPGTRIGRFCESVRRAVGFDAAVTLPASHDTGSAFAGVPFRDSRSVAVSSGSWSLVGVERDAPVITDAGRRENFSNEGGYGGKIRFLHNIMGLWMLQSIRRERPENYGYPELQAMAEDSDYAETVDVGDPVFIAPDNMENAVRNLLARDKKPLPKTLGDTLCCIYRSLAAAYASAVGGLSAVTGERYTHIHIVGGGSRDDYLNRLTAAAAGVPVTAGPVECTAAGNLIAQMIAAGVFSDIGAARAAVADSFSVRTFSPET